jgi:hypothetical protein
MDIIVGLLDKIGIVLVLEIILANLLLGVVIGVGKTVLARLQALLMPRKRVFSAREYTSAFFGRDLPLGFFNLLTPMPSFVVVDYEDDRVKQETFYSLLGDHRSFVDGRPTLIGSSILSSPFYLIVAALPMLLGFLGAIFLFWVPFIEKYASPYLVSGFVGNLLMLIIPTLIYRNWGNNSTSE